MRTRRRKNFAVMGEEVGEANLLFPSPMGEGQRRLAA